MSKIKPLRELTDWRKANEISRKELANKLGVTETTVWRWEMGERAPARRYLPRMSRLTGISPAALLGV